MFQLHDKTRRRICVALFMGLCVFPTVVIGAWCVSRQLPGYTAAEALRLESQLGLDVNLAQFSHPTPGVALYRGLELVDPESGRTVARCRMLEATWGETSDSQGNSQPVLILTASQPEIEGESFDQLSRLVDRLLRGNTTAADVSIRFSAAEVTFVKALFSTGGGILDIFKRRKKLLIYFTIIFMNICIFITVT